MTDLPPLDSVWRHNETEEVREVINVNDKWVTFAMSGCDFSVEPYIWHAWQSNATCLDPSADAARVAELEAERDDARAAARYMLMFIVNEPKPLSGVIRRWPWLDGIVPEQDQSQ